VCDVARDIDALVEAARERCTAARVGSVVHGWRIGDAYVNRNVLVLRVVDGRVDDWATDGRRDRAVAPGTPERAQG
jgi:hypothetical protein